MLLTIHNLPTGTEYSDIKELILSKCGLRESILDQLQNEGSGMRVTVGVMAEEDAAILVRKINGVYFRGKQLYVENKRQSKESEQPYRTTTIQSSQYMVAEGQIGYDFNTLQAMGMYQPMANYAMFASVPVDQTIQNSYIAYEEQGKAAAHAPIQQYGSFDYTQQAYVPLVQQNPEPANLFTRKKSPRPNRPEQGGGGWRIGGPDRPHARRDDAPLPQRQYVKNRVYDGRLESEGYVRPQERTERPPGRPERLQERAERSQGRSNKWERRPEWFQEQAQRSQEQTERPQGRSNKFERRPEWSQEQTEWPQGRSNKWERRLEWSQEQAQRPQKQTDSPQGRANSWKGRPEWLQERAERPQGQTERPQGRSNKWERRPEFSQERAGRLQEQKPKWSQEKAKRPQERPDRRPTRDDNEHGRYLPPLANEKHADRQPRDTQYRKSREGERDCGGPADRTRDALPNKRRWEDANEQRDRGSNHRDMPLVRPNKLAQHSLDKKEIMVDNRSPQKMLRLTKIKGAGKVMFAIANNMNIMHLFDGPNALKSELRREVAKRMHEIVDQPIMSADAILERYRQVYPESDDFIILEDAKLRIAEKELVDPIDKKTIKRKWDANVPQHLNSPEQKQPHKKEKATLVTFQVNETLQKAIKEEIDMIGDLVANELKNPKTMHEKTIFDSFDQNTCIERSKKTLVYHTSRRIKNIGKKTVRIYGNPRLPHIKDLEEYLFNYDCLLLKKATTSPFYVAAFETYKTVDMLCAMGPVPIGYGEVEVNFKHVLTTAKHEQKDFTKIKELRQKFINSVIDRSEVNLLSKDWEIKEKEEKKARANKKHLDLTEDGVEIEKVEFTFNKGKLKASENSSDLLDGEFEVIDEVRESEDEAPSLNNETNDGDDELRSDVGEDDAVEDGDDDGKEDVNSGDESENGESIEEFGDIDIDLYDLDEDDLEDY